MTGVTATCGSSGYMAVVLIDLGVLLLLATSVRMQLAFRRYNSSKLKAQALATMENANAFGVSSASAGCGSSSWGARADGSDGGAHGSSLSAVELTEIDTVLSGRRDDCSRGSMSKSGSKSQSGSRSRLKRALSVAASATSATVTAAAVVGSVAGTTVSTVGTAVKRQREKRKAKASGEAGTKVAAGLRPMAARDGASKAERRPIFAGRRSGGGGYR